MDLSSIKKKIELGVKIHLLKLLLSRSIIIYIILCLCYFCVQSIKTDMEFQRDMLLMFQNAFMYNSSDHDVFFMAQFMKSDVMENIQVRETVAYK